MDITINLEPNAIIAVAIAITIICVAWIVKR